MAKGKQRQISFGRLVYRSVPELGSYQILTGIVLALPTSILNYLISDLVASYGTSITSSNILDLVKNWRFPVLAVLVIILVLWVFILEVLSPVFISRDILTGSPISMFREAKESVAAMGKFFNARGLLKILFTLLIVPLCGFGATLSLTKNMYIPNFIMEVVDANQVYSILYGFVMAVFAVIAFLMRFSLPAVVLDGKEQKEADRASFRLVKEHWKDILKKGLTSLLVIALIAVLYYAVFVVAPFAVFTVMDDSIPKEPDLDITEMGDLMELSDTDIEYIAYRFGASLALIIGRVIGTYLLSLLIVYTSLRTTAIYLEYTHGHGRLYPDRPDRKLVVLGLLPKLIVLAACVLLAGLLALPLGNALVPDTTGIIAHRTGGTMAFENSLEGLRISIEHGCYGEETDIQRTIDGYYIINHDSTFKRVAGDSRKPVDMTLEEIEQIRLRDSSGNEYKVPTLEAMLDMVKGKSKLFIELKGSTADRRMVDDVVAMVRERDCMENVALISLDYKVIDYAETAYPEFETGTLFFMGIGDVSRLNCDFLMMEEETANTRRIAQIHAAGKKAMIWTVNTRENLYRFMSGFADAVITDEVILAESVQKELDGRTLYQEMDDLISIIWS